MTRLARVILIVLVIGVCIAVDQVTKEMARTHLPGSGGRALVGDLLILDYTENRGATFSFEQLLPPHWRGKGASIIVGAVAGTLALGLVLAPRPGAFSVIAWSLFIGGSLSNLLDRIVWGGDVVDFLELGWGPFRTCLFNAADIAIVAGLSLAALNVLRYVGNVRTGTPLRLEN